ncbi:hypothetical protein CYMTET_33488, partial [Cymbomonas tetramitiformis]
MNHEDAGEGHARAGDLKDNIISIDRSGLWKSTESSDGPAVPKIPSSELIREMKSSIQIRGSLSMAEYMKEVLTHPTEGFYMKRDVFGSTGDFITSPEISQMFGEMLGIWSVCLWQQMGCPKKVSIVELGPGRGTLMADFLRGTKVFAPFMAAVEVHLVEVSPKLREMQYKKLACVSEELEGASIGFLLRLRTRSPLQSNMTPPLRASPWSRAAETRAPRRSWRGRRSPPCGESVSCAGALWSGT